MIRLGVLVIGWFVFAGLSDLPAMFLCVVGIGYVLAARNKQHEGYTPWQKIP